MSIFAGEFFLKSRPNGGTVVLRRALFVSFLLYTLAIGAKSRLAAGATWTFDFAVARALVAETIPWLGAIFAGVYVALYTRFASQWSYLAGLYNQIMQAQVESAATPGEKAECLALWQAGFIEDAEDLHLSRKVMFAPIIANMLTNADVRKAYVEYAPGGEARLRKLELSVEKVMDRIRKRYAATTPVPEVPVSQAVLSSADVPLGGTAST